MIEKLDTGIDHSQALKDALVLRRNGTITPLLDNMLGLIVYNIARWVVAERDVLWREKPDVISDLNLKLLMVIDKVDLSRPAPQILGYLRNAARNAHTNMLEAMHCQKRTGELVDIENLPIATDFRGQRIY